MSNHQDEMYISAYYFRAHSYTIVPHQVREDMAWMADHGTKGVVVGILEQDLYASVPNYEIIAREAERYGMEMWATPSRWGNLIAGCPKVPSAFTVCNPCTWALDKERKPYMNFRGPIASVHHPVTVENFCKLTEEMLRTWPIKGIIWDELKNLELMDYSPAACAVLGEAVDDPEAHLKAHAQFLGNINTFAKSVQPDVTTSCFLFASYDGKKLEYTADMADLDEFGCDGRPWSATDAVALDRALGTSSSKSLLDGGNRFIQCAKDRNLRSLALIENLSFTNEMNPLMEQAMPTIFKQGWDHLIYYYYPREVEDPERSMQVLGNALKGR